MAKLHSIPRRNFRANRRAYWSLILFSVLYVISLGAELLANDRPLLVSYRGNKQHGIADFEGMPVRIRQFVVQRKKIT